MAPDIGAPNKNTAFLSSELLKLTEQALQRGPALKINECIGVCVECRTRVLGIIDIKAHVGDIRQCGYMVGIELVQDRKTKAPFPLEDRMGHQVAMECRSRGLLIRPIGNVLVLMPPLCVEAKHLKKMATILKKSIQRITIS